MDKVGCQHHGLADGRWGELSFCAQMGNLGSEVSRAVKWLGKNEKRFQVSFERALELFDMTIEAAKDDDIGSRAGKLREVCRAREEFCDYFMGNTWGTDAGKMVRYYDQFAMRAREAAEGESVKAIEIAGRANACVTQP